ncbi:MAG: hypothetical protein AMXMBFR7_27620 [Planctomycetota bacterium]
MGRPNLESIPFMCARIVFVCGLLILCSAAAQDAVYEWDGEPVVDPNKEDWTRTQSPAAKASEVRWKVERERIEHAPLNGAWKRVSEFQAPPRELKPGEFATLLLRSTGTNTDGLETYYEFPFIECTFDSKDLPAEQLEYCRQVKRLAPVSPGVFSGTYTFKVPDAARGSFTISACASGFPGTVYKYKLKKPTAVYDANPVFNGGALIHLEASAERRIELFCTAATARSAAACDGTSLLLLRVAGVPDGQAVFELEGPESGGTLHAFDANPFKDPGGPRLDTRTVVSKTLGAVALAFYKPPAQFDAGTAHDKKPHRACTVKVSTVSAAGTPGPSAALSFKLVRPPVILVHGTYDEPRNCWQLTLGDVGLTYKVSMEDRLKNEGFSVYLVDWQKTNGNTDPSDFKTNEKMVRDGPGGIKTAIRDYQSKGCAATKCDLVCHSQGGVLPRVYAKGVRSDRPRPDTDDHYVKPEACECWYHRPPEPDYSHFRQGDINRLLTISSTHHGSDLSKLFATYKDIREDWVSAATNPSAGGLMWKAGARMTGGFYDQMPQSIALAAIGKTELPAHAIACICEDTDLMLNDEEFLKQLESIWSWGKGQAADVFTQVGQARDALILKAAIEAEDTDLDKLNNALRMRAATFGNKPNDTTVREESSLGGLKPPFATTIEHVLHSYAPRYESVQNRVVELLKNRGTGQWSAAGFPPAGKAMRISLPEIYTPAGEEIVKLRAAKKP